jgi:DNA-binding XRE family transcriptional regulator
MAKAAAPKSAGALTPGFEDKIRDARYQVIADQFLVTFDSGKEYAFSRSLLECDDGTDVVKVEVDEKRFFFRVFQASGNKYEVPWDRVLYEAQASYPYRRGDKAKIERSVAVGRRVKSLRKVKGMTQAQLARAAGILRPNLSRLESGKHRPSLETLEKIAAALKLPVVDLVLRK